MKKQTVKKSPMEAKIDRLATAVDRGFVAVAGDIADTRTTMLSGFARIEERLYSIEQELKDIKRRLVKLEDNYEAVKEYGVDIRELQGRVKAIEKQIAVRR